MDFNLKERELEIENKKFSILSESGKERVVIYKESIIEIWLLFYTKLSFYKHNQNIIYIIEILYNDRTNWMYYLSYTM